MKQMYSILFMISLLATAVDCLGQSCEGVCNKICAGKHPDMFGWKHKDYKPGGARLPFGDCISAIEWCEESCKYYGKENIVEARLDKSNPLWVID